MTSELFLASILFAAGSSITVYLLLSARINRRSESTGGMDDFDLTPIESRLADLVTDMNRVANSHTKAIADRRDELKRVIETANDRIRRLNTDLADLAILEQRLRDPRRAEGLGADPAGRPGVVPVDTIVEDAAARWERPGETPREAPPVPPQRRRARPPVERVPNPEGGAWVFEVPGPSASASRDHDVHAAGPLHGQDRSRDIESLAAGGLSPAAIASRLRLPLHAVEQVLGGRGRH